MSIFCTDRLSVRPLNRDDFDAFFEMECDGTVLKHAVVNPDLIPLAIRMDLDQLLQAYSQPVSSLDVWAIENEDGQMVGTCALVANERDHAIGYRLIKRYWGRGDGSELCEGLINYALYERRLTHLVAVAVNPIWLPLKS